MNIKQHLRTSTASVPSVMSFVFTCQKVLYIPTSRSGPGYCLHFHVTLKRRSVGVCTSVWSVAIAPLLRPVVRRPCSAVAERWVLGGAVDVGLSVAVSAAARRLWRLSTPAGRQGEGRGGEGQPVPAPVRPSSLRSPAAESVTRYEPLPTWLRRRRRATSPSRCCRSSGRRWPSVSRQWEVRRDGGGGGESVERKRHPAV